MEWFTILKARLRALFRREDVLQDIEEELRIHVEMETERNVGRGMPPDEARSAARKSFGNVVRNTELSYDVRGGGWLETLWQDLRFGARMLRKQPGFSLVAVATLALGIGANTAIFSIVNAVLLRPFPYQAPERLVMLQERYTAGGFSPSYPNFADWRVQNSVFEATSAVRPNESFNLTGVGEPERLRGCLVSAEFLSTLGIQPIVGRDFLAEEDRPGATPAAILSYGFWRRRFAEDPGIIGKQLTLNKQTFTVVGVTPANFQFYGKPMSRYPLVLQAERFKGRGSDPGVDAVARLRPGVSLEQAEGDLNMIAARLEQQYPASNKGRRALVTPLHERFVGNVRRPLLILLGAVGVVLLISCANVANLLLVRASARQRKCRCGWRSAPVGARSFVNY
jgi:predicted permease